MTKQAGDTFGKTYPALGQGTVQNVAIGASSLQSNAVGATTASVTLTADTDCWVLLGQNPTATSATGEHLPAGVKWCRRIVTAGDKVAVIQKGSGTGNLNIVEDA